MAKVKKDSPILFSYDPGDFWAQVRLIVREEIRQMPRVSLNPPDGLTNKPLYKMDELCMLFSISRPTAYEWIKAGKLHPVKIRSRVFFRGDEVERLMKG